MAGAGQRGVMIGFQEEQEDENTEREAEAEQMFIEWFVHKFLRWQLNRYLLRKFSLGKVNSNLDKFCV